MQAVLLKRRASEPVIHDDGKRSVISLGGGTAAQGTGIAADKASAGF